MGLLMDSVNRTGFLAVLYGVVAGLSLTHASCSDYRAAADGEVRTLNTEMVPAERRTTWNPGLNAVGGIPSRTTICATLSPSGGDDTAAIQAALDNCPANQVVKLNTGDFRISGGGLEINRSNIVLRGSGPTATRLLKTDQAQTNGLSVIVIGNRWSADKFMTGSINLSANGVKGSRAVTLASTPGPALAVGEIVLLDQVTNPSLSWWGNCPSGDACRGWFSRNDRPISQVLEVESAGGNQVTFTTPLHIDFLTAYTAQLSRYGEDWKGLVPATRRSGVEDLYVEKGGGGNIALEVCAYCWVKAVESAHSIGPSASLSGCFRSVVRDSYIHTSDDPNPGGGGYLLAVDMGSADNLIENNIVMSGNKVMVMRASGGGNVIGYNYMEDSYGADYPTIVETGINAAHMTTAHMELFEGNQSFNFDADATWGNQIYITVLRNQLTGKRRSVPPLNLIDIDNRRAIGLTINSWWYTFLGNVLGYAGMTPRPARAAFIYEWTGDWNAGVPMWQLGYDGQNWGTTPDAKVVATTIRHGNFDYVTNTTVWDPGIADHNLPLSLYLTSKPAFFGAHPWPWVDPTGATKTDTLPARARFDEGHPAQP